jgi:Tfp pilus assembly protein PilF
MNTAVRKTAIAFAALSILGAGAAHAGYRMTAFGDTPGFAQIMAEDYEAASAKLEAPFYDTDRYARFANRCVSELLSHEVDAAMQSCQRALSVAPADLMTSLTPSFHKRAEVLTHLYSNRGVVRAVSGDVFGAREDFERALELDEANDNARSNLELIAAGDVAQQAN